MPVFQRLQPFYRNVSRSHCREAAVYSSVGTRRLVDPYSKILSHFYGLCTFQVMVLTKICTKRFRFSMEVQCLAHHGSATTYRRPQGQWLFRYSPIAEWVANVINVDRKWRRLPNAAIICFWSGDRDTADRDYRRDLWRNSFSMPGEN